MDAEAIVVEVVYAGVEQQVLMALTVAADACVQQVIEQSGLLQRFAEIDLQVNKVGIWGRLVNLNDGVQEGDRIEIYRPLRQDPMEARRQRAAR